MSLFLAVSYWLLAISYFHNNFLLLKNYTYHARQEIRYFHNNVFVVKMVDLPRSARKIGAG
jgi:hypothetical protein